MGKPGRPCRCRSCQSTAMSSPQPATTQIHPAPPPTGSHRPYQLLRLFGCSGQMCFFFFFWLLLCCGQAWFFAAPVVVLRNFKFLLSPVSDRALLPHPAPRLLRHLRAVHPPGGVPSARAWGAAAPAALPRIQGGCARTGTTYVCVCVCHTWAKGV